MKSRTYFSLACLLSLLFHGTISGIEPYDLIEALLLKEQLPRVINSTDVDLNPNDPQPLFTPEADFNGDGIPDMAISGIYGLPKKHRYFLLVGTQFRNPVRTEKLFFREFAEPVFLHKPGTTGEKDPGDQAFSITACSQCSDGMDFYWNGKENTFDQRRWVKRIRHYRQVPHIPEKDLVPPETVDKALKIVGDLKDVKIFVAGLKKAGKELGTRVKTAGPIDAPYSLVTVEIFEKGKRRENVYDNITVDVEKSRVMKRRRGR